MRKVMVGTMLLADYHINHIKANCRARGVPILHTFYDRLMRGSKRPYLSSSNGISAQTFIIRRHDYEEFMGLFGCFIRWVLFMEAPGLGYRGREVFNFGPMKEYVELSIREDNRPEPYYSQYCKRWRCGTVKT